MNTLGTMIGSLCLAVVFPIFPAQAATAETSGRVAGTPMTAKLRMAQEVPDRLVVTRTNNNVNNPAAPSFSKTITDQASVQRLYADIAALPSFPAGTMNCPNDLGIHYRLDFYSGPVSLLTGDYQPSGCASVKLSQGIVKSDPAGNFKADLGQALGLSDRQLLGFQ